MGTINILCKRGDTKTVWDPRNPDEVAMARATFTNLKAKGYIAFRTDSAGEKATRMDAFDPEAGSIIMAPQLKGG